MTPTQGCNSGYPSMRGFIKRSRWRMIGTTLLLSALACTAGATTFADAVPAAVTVHGERVGMAGQTAYRIIGQGPAVLIINGGPGLDSAGFESVARQIANMGLQAILYDQRGTGGSNGVAISAETMRLQSMVEDIEQLRQHLQLPELILFGHSFGGLLAAAYADQHPAQVRALILSSPAGLDLQFREGFSDRLNQNLTLAQRTELALYDSKIGLGDDSAATRQARAEVLAHGYVLDANKAAGVAARLAVVNMTINQLIHADLTAQHFDLSDQFRQFQPPVLVLQGDKDVLSVDNAKRTAQAFAHAELVVMPHCAHYGWLDQPTLYYAALGKFIQQHVLSVAPTIP